MLVLPYLLEIGLDVATQCILCLKQALLAPLALHLLSSEWLTSRRFEQRVLSLLTVFEVAVVKALLKKPSLHPATYRQIYNLHCVYPTVNCSYINKTK